MRDIIFRGKNNKGIWCYGNLILRKDGTYLISPDETPIGHYGAVYKESVGQYTGIKDINEKEIYEGDIVRFRFKTDRLECPDLIGFIEYQEQYCSFKIVSSPENGASRIDDEIMIKVIGNIYDNPELL